MSWFMCKKHGGAVWRWLTSTKGEWYCPECRKEISGEPKGECMSGEYSATSTIGSGDMLRKERLELSGSFSTEALIRNLRMFQTDTVVKIGFNKIVIEGYLKP